MQVGETAVYEVGLSADAANELISFIGYQAERGNYVPYVLLELSEFLTKEMYGEVHEASMARKDTIHYGFPNDAEV